MAGGDGTSFTITELGGEKRELRLSGGALPYRPFELKTQQRLELSWLPGNPQATSTILGPSEGPTSINGYWKDIKFSDVSGSKSPFMVDNQAIADVFTAHKIADSFCRAGQLLEVAWFGITRHGHLKEIDWRWHNAHDVEWVMNFEWISRGEPQAPAVFVQSAQVQTIGSNFRQAFDNVVNIPSPSFNMHYDVFETLTTMTANISSSIFSIENSIATFVQTASTTPSIVMKNIVATCNSVVSNTQTMISYLRTMPPSELVYGTLVQDLSYAERLATQSWIRQVLTQLQELKRIVIEQQDQLIDNFSGDIKGRYFVKAGQDLRDVSQIFYGTPFEWRRIMLFNQLQSSMVETGTLVLVPKINPSDLQLIQP
jgi:nucleoid-associated protein YgaU